MPAMNSGEESPNTMRESGFRASLHGTSLADLVQMECLSGRERVLRVSSGNEVGYLYFRAGQIVHAVSRRGIGESAALEILRWNDGSIEPCSAGWPDRDSISSNWQNLLLIAAQHRDESGRHNLVAFPGTRTAVTRTTSPPPPSSAPTSGSSRLEGNVSSEPTPMLAQVRAAVRLDQSGNVVSSKGEAAELGQVAAYAARLAELVGDGLGMLGLVSVEVTQQRSRTLIYREKSGNTFALTAAPDADLSQVRERLGL
ncbi:MAG: putative domain GTPase-activating protein [Polyangiaceae bacterium]|nr:putative domain GTPase-activating protein [Polyangiaceae bacterium]